MARFPAIQTDLEYFSASLVLDIPTANDEAEALAANVLRRSMRSPMSLLGYLYVLEGSVSGARELAPVFRQALGADATPDLAYFTWEDAVADERWREFGARMNALDCDDTDAGEIEAAASEAYAGFARLFEALYPFDPALLTRRIASLNPEAGVHAMPSDPAEVDAALRAGSRCWQEYPYFAWRYGERGWRFTLSDGAWLVTLAGHQQHRIDSQVKWLAGVLASRGMPSLLLQRHLELTYEELAGRLTPHPGMDYSRLLVAADVLAQRRRTAIADEDLDVLAAGFDQAVGPDWRVRLPHTGALLACAVADRANGVEAAVSSLEPWFTDPQRFPSQWLAAVQTTLSEAEARIRG